MEEHPRFKDVKLGIIVSSLRALQLFLRKSARTGRLPDYVVVEGPLAGGHLGFGLDDWMKHDLRAITDGNPRLAAPGEARHPGDPGRRHLHRHRCGVVSGDRFGRRAGGDALHGGEGMRPAGEVQQEYFKASEDDIEVNGISPTGYPMRMLKNSPAIGSGIRPNCEAFGYLLDSNGHCAYIDAYLPRGGGASRPEEDRGAGQDLPVHPHAQLRLLDLRPLPPTG
jgi:nitronate monooxygenase